MKRFREPTSGFTHLFAAIVGILWVVWLVALTIDDPPIMITMLIYGFGMVFLYFASAFYHLNNGSPETIRMLLRFDLVGIYLLIAGTYTPIAYFFLEGNWRWMLLGGVWIPTIAGIIYTIFFHERQPKQKDQMFFFYLGIGCIGILGTPYFVRILPTGALVLIILGGITYAIGSVIYSIEKPNLHRYFNAHDLWHIFVMLGNSFFFIAILQYIARGS